jgi:transcriptional regulator with GAF, ATPase, and Fis domain/tetratricopeptide (TPR) repeat protein
MGSVWLALDQTTGSECALKRLDANLPPSERQSLRREFEVLARVRHPSVVSVHELGFTPDGAPYYTMEVVPGLAADLALAGGDGALFHACAAELAHALEVLHAAGVVHGDVKPSNVLVVRAPGGECAGVKLVDLGLAAVLGRDPQRRRGTLGYAAPEVLAGEPLSVATDLFGLGATLYVLALTCGGGARASRSAVRPPQAITDCALMLEEAAVGQPLARLILRLLSPDPRGRPADAREVRRELERLHPAARRDLTERLHTSVLVGRAAELARLERWLGAAAPGPALLLLAGDLGSGRSALLAEFAVRATMADHPVIPLSGHDDERAGLVPTLARRIAIEAGVGGDPDASALLARLERGPGGVTPLPEGLERHVRAWVARFRDRERGPLVIVDDADAATAESRAFMLRLALDPDAGALRWVWCTTQARGDEALAERLWEEAGRAERLELGPLDRDALHDLIAARLRRTPSDGLTEALWERSGGRPGLAVETLLAAASAGAIADGESGITLDRERLSSLPMPAGFEQGCLARLRSLGDAAWAAAAALAVRVEPSTPAELQRIEPRANETALAALAREGLLSRDAADRCQLAPPGLARTVRDALDGTLRSALHRSALELPGLTAAQRFRHHAGAGQASLALVEAERALAEGAGIELAVEAAAVAAHEPARVAAGWEERAARMLLERGRYREAIPPLLRALERAPDDPARAARWHALSGAFLRTGADTELAALLQRALAEPLAEHERARLLTNDAMRRSVAGDADGAEAAAREAFALAERSGDGEALSLAALTLGNLCCARGRVAEADELARVAEDAGARAGYALGRIRGTGLRAFVAGLWRDFEAAERLYRASLEEARALGARLPQNELASNLAWVLVERGQWADAREAMAEALRVALEEGWPRAAAFGLVHLTLLDTLTGRTSQAVTRARAALRAMQRHERSHEAYAWRTLALALRVTGRTRSGSWAARRALQVAERAEQPDELAWCRIEYGLQCARLGDWPEAARVWERGSAEAAPDQTSTPILAALRGRAALRAGEPAAAEARLAEAEAWLADRTAPYAEACVRQLRAELALARGQAVEGSREAAATLAAFAGLPAPGEAAAAALEYARVATRAGLAARTPVPDWLREAAAGFGRLGDHPQRELALAQAVDWYRRQGGRRAFVTRDRDLLASVTRLLDSQPDLDELCRRAMRLAVDQLDAERGVLVLASGATAELEPVVEFGAIDAATRDQALSYSREVVQRVAQSGGSLLLGDASADLEKLSHSMVELGLRSILCVPMFGGGKVVGAVYLDDSRRADVFGVAERGLLEGFAHLLAVAIENSRGHEQVRRANEQLVGENLLLRREVSARFRPPNFMGQSLAMRQVLAVVERAADIASTVLITGENGTGKELIARMLHFSGARSMKPFVEVNCGAIPPTLLESELFGILPDVATGVRARPGRFVEANGGTLFLDEVGEMPPAQQVALLGVLSNRKVVPVGGGPPVEVDVRVIAATNRDLAKLVSEGKFRQDLFYRLNVVPIALPPLRERKADIPALARQFAAVVAAQHDRAVPELSPRLLAVLMQHDWPGNVRELQNYIERLMALSADTVLQPEPMPDELRSPGSIRRVPGGGRARPLREHVAELEKRRLLEALDRSGGNQSRAARDLGITEQALRYRLRKYGLLRVRQFRRVR